MGRKHKKDSEALPDTAIVPDRSLDSLLEDYLILLDQYQTLQDQLTSALSSGYISLAQANFQAPSRVRYCQDFYDERMQARARLSMKKPENQGRSVPHWSIERSIEPPAKPEAADATGKEGSTTTLPESASKEGQDDSTPIEANSASKANEKEKEKEDASTPSEEKAVRNQDPLRWFGILVPPSLRTAQTAFVGAVDTLPRLVEVERRLAEVEGLVKFARERDL
ncbi:MAG: hypothetical protein M4579_001737 [Chaenotheca gracillima]|nr:MAG: hypothetical protein M4579_001737 [Chaenotheca gracillima]